MKSFLKEQGLLLSILLIGFLFRVLFIFTIPFDSDMAFLGIMAKHILHGEFPLLFYGDTYGSSFGAYLTAPFIGLFGLSVNVLNFSLLPFSLLFILTTYWLGKIVCNKEVGLIAALLAAICPYFVTNYNLQAQNGYVETLVIGNIILFLTCRMLNHDLFRFDWKQYGLLGFFYGLGYAYHPQCIFYISTSAIFVFYLTRKELFTKKIGSLILFACLGAGCILFWNITNDFPFLKFTKSYAAETFSLASQIGLLFKERIPLILGVLHHNEKKWILPLISQCALLLFAAGFVFAVLSQFRRWLKVRTLEKVDVLLLYLAILPLVFFASDFYKAPTQRYLIFLYPVLAILLGALLWKISQSFRKFAYLLLAVVLVSNMASNIYSDIFPSKERRKELQAEKNKSQALFDFLADRGYLYNYAGDYWDVAKNNFYFDEKIILSEPFSDRYPLWTLKADAFSKPAYVLASGPARLFQNSMLLLGGNFAVGYAGRWRIYYDFLPPPRESKEIDPKEWKIKSNVNQDKAAHAIDRKINTYWRSDQPGAYLELDFGQKKRVNQIVLLMEKDGMHTPGSFKVLTSVDGERWQEARKSDTYSTPLFWSGPHPFWKQRDGRMEIHLNPQKIQYLRIQNTQEKLTHAWFVCEWLVYEQNPDIFSPAYDLSGPIHFIKEHQISKVYCDFWESAEITLKTRGKIQCLTREYKLAGTTDYYSNGYDGTFPYFNDLRRDMKLSQESGILLLKDQASGVEQKLKEEYQFQTQVMNDYVLFYHFESIYKKLKKLPHQDWVKEETEYTIDLGKEELLQQVEIFLKKKIRNHSMSIAMAVSLDRNQWKEVAFLERNTFYWTGVNIVDVQRKHLRYLMDPITARYVKIKLYHDKEPFKGEVKRIYLYE